MLDCSTRNIAFKFRDFKKEKRPKRRIGLVSCRYLECAERVFPLPEGCVEVTTKDVRPRICRVEKGELRCFKEGGGAIDLRNAAEALCVPEYAFERKHVTPTRAIIGMGEKMRFGFRKFEPAF